MVGQLSERAGALYPIRCEAISNLSIISSAEKA